VGENHISSGTKGNDRRPGATQVSSQTLKDIKNSSKMKGTLAPDAFSLNVE